MGSFEEHRLLILETLRKNEDAINGFANELKSSLTDVYDAMSSSSREMMKFMWGLFVLTLGIMGSMFGYSYMLIDASEERTIHEIHKVEDDLTAHIKEDSVQYNKSEIIHFQLKEHLKDKN